MTTNKNPLDRAVIFVDGSNFFRGMKEAGLSPAKLDYALFSQKLACAHEWIETRYYAGRVRQEGHPSVYRSQRQLLSRLDKLDRVNYYLGRVESRPATEGAKKLNRWLNALQWRSDIDVSAQTVR